MKTTLKNLAVGVVAGSVIFTSAHGDTLRLPCKYVRTTTTYNALTGNILDEKQKDKLKMVPLDIRKATIDGEARITITKQAVKGETETEGVLAGSIHYDEKGELISKLLAAKKKLDRASFAKTDEKEAIFTGDGLAFDLTISKPAFLLLSVGPADDSPAQFVLSAPQVQQLIDAIKKL